MTISEVNTALELPVMEQFYTIQGEGKNSGRAAYFIRLAGCDVGCVWCDVKESWNREEHPLVKIDDLVAEVKNSGTDFVVITGGEPAMYDLTALTAKLKALRVEIAMETSGCYPLNGHIDWYCFSPKKFKQPCDEAYEKASEIKIIIAHPSDFAWAEGHAERVNPGAVKYLQTEWSKQERFLPMIIEYVKENPSWKISLQTHKYMNIP
ncbi:MAG: 7-carboxy-7-deazaguanine synthase QueE [Crocinitomicaceae bacterium]|jgi:organic radical activating enzyme|nr:7-carboxy-7-deazaguanine synthase QueE [Crocinitomicaceae bacterium]